MSNIYFIGLKKRLVWGVLDIEEIHDKDNEIMFERWEGGINMLIYST